MTGKKTRDGNPRVRFDAKRGHAVAAGIVAAALSLLAGVAWGKSFSLDLRNSGKATKAFAANHSGPATSYATDGILRSFDLDAGVADVGEVAVGDELTFTLFDDVSITLTLKVKAPSPLGGDVFLAEASGYSGVKNAVVLRTADGLTIDVQDYRNAKMYKVISTASGVAVREQDASRTGTCGCESEGLTGLDGDVASPSATESTINGVPISRSADVAYVDVLVAYDSKAKAWAETNGGGMLTFAQLAVQKMNTVLYNNELYAAFRFRLVGVVDVSVSSTSLGDVLNAAVNGTGGWAPIKAKRDAVGADIVTVLIDTGSAYGTTGLGMSLDKANYNANSFSESPYNVCSIRSVAQSHTMTHEVGHNMGCGHAKEQASEPGPQLFSYSAGYYYSLAGTWYHTIMAYGGECPYGDGTAVQAPYFSDDYDYVDPETGLTFHPGEEQAYNQYTLYMTYEMASNWRAEKGIDLESGYISNNVEWKRSRDEAFAKAKSEGKKVFVVCGRDSCLNTQGTRENCNQPSVKRILDQNFVCWYNKYDDESSQVYRYLSGFSIGNTFPFIAVIDAVNDITLKAEGNYHYVEDLLNLLGDIPGVTYTLTRNPNGGTYNGKTTAIVDTDGLQTGKGNFWSIGIPARSGYAFDGWWTAMSGGVKVYDVSGNCIVGDYWDSSKHYVHEGNLTVYAHWRTISGKKYTLTLNPNGGTYQGKTAATVRTDGLQTGKSNYWGVGIPTRTGYAFDGWWTKASGGVQVYGPDGNCLYGAYWSPGKLYAYEGSLTVYAHWKVSETRYTLTINPNGGTYKGKTTATVIPNALAYGSTDYNSIGVPTRTGRKFRGWYTQASGGQRVYTEYGGYVSYAGLFWMSGAGAYNLHSDLAVYAQWEETLADAVDCPSLTFTTGGDKPWEVYYSDYHKGSSSIRSGEIDNSQSSWIQTTVSGPGWISFWGVASCEEGYDCLKFLVDGQEVTGFTGTGDDWKQVVSYKITAGSHVLKWIYIKDSSTSKGKDLGLIDEINWTPSSANISAQIVKPEQTADDGTELSLAELAAGTFDGVVAGADGGVAGVVTLTVSADGAISGKVLKDGLVRTITADEVTLAIDESAPFRRAVATGDGWIAWQNVWKAEPWKSAAEPFAEAPVLVTPDGVELKFSSSGAVTAKLGAYSCSSVLIPVASPSTPNFSLYLYFPPKAGEFEGYAAEIPLAWDGAAFSTR